MQFFAIMEVHVHKNYCMHCIGTKYVKMLVSSLINTSSCPLQIPENCLHLLVASLVVLHMKHTQHYMTRDTQCNIGIRCIAQKARLFSTSLQQVSIIEPSNTKSSFSSQIKILTKHTDYDY